MALDGITIANIVTELRPLSLRADREDRAAGGR